MSVPEECPVCSESRETPLHLFVLCPFARLVWAVCGLRAEDVDCKSSDIWEWFAQVRRKLQKDDFEFFVCLCWSLWKHRNMKIHKECSGDALFEVQQVRNCLQLYRHARFGLGYVRSSGKNQVSSEWCRPPVGWIKVNFDAAINGVHRVMGLGIVARDTTGSVIWWKHKIVAQSVTPEVGEAMAAVEAISLVVQKGWPSVLIEGDCLRVVNDLNSSNLCLSEAGCFIHEGRKLLQRIRQFKITHVYRDQIV